MQKPSQNEQKFSWWDLAKAFHYLLDSKRKSYYTYSFIVILILFYDLVPTYLVAKIVDFFTSYTPGDSLSPFYKILAFLTITIGIVSFIRLSLKKRLSLIRSEVEYFTRVKGFEKLMDFSLKWHDSENTGNKVQRIQNGAEAFKNTQNILAMEVFSHGASLIGVLGAFIFMRPTIFFYSLIYIAIFAAIQMSFYKQMERTNYTHNTLMEKASGTYFEGLSNILTIKTLGVKNDFKKNINSREELTRDYAMKKTTVMNNKWKVFQIVNALSLGGALLLIGKDFIAGAISLGSIFLFYNYFQKLAGAVAESTNTVDKLVTAKVGIARMMPIFNDEVVEDNGALEFPKDWNTLEVANGTFHYPKQNTESEAAPTVAGLENVNVSIKRFEKVGVVGKSGSGKSTFAKVLLGLYEFTHGTFTIGTTPFKDIKHDSLTHNVALVLQESEMFNLSLKENITLMRAFDEALFEKALSISQLNDVIAKLPSGVDTLIGEKGYRLSGGERQRIGIARAIYKDPEILVLDEATSSLDSKTEGLIQHALEEHLEKKTVISIAHRISTLKNVNKIIVFDKGTVVEQGTFKQLSNDTSSKFYELNQSQQKTRKKVAVAEPIIIETKTA